jgi:hypothetical protein
VRRFGAARVEPVCTLALAAELYDVHRLKRMLEHAAAPVPPAAPRRPVPPARYLRPATLYVLRAPTPAPTDGGAA